MMRHPSKSWVAGACLFVAYTSARYYWERHARRYDVSLRFLLAKPIPRMLELTRTAVRGCSRVLEVGAGTGLVTTAIAESAASVLATDYAETMVAILKDRVHRAGLTNVTFQQADLYDLSYPRGEFDAVVAANILHLMPDVPGALLSLRHVLRPGGLFIAPTFCHGQTALSRLISAALSLSGFPGQLRFTARSLEESLAAGGIRVGRIEVLSGPIPITYIDGTFT